MFFALRRFRVISWIVLTKGNNTNTVRTFERANRSVPREASPQSEGLSHETESLPGISKVFLANPNSSHEMSAEVAAVVYKSTLLVNQAALASRVGNRQPIDESARP